MNCLLVAATAYEISPFINYYRKTNKGLHMDIYIDILISGIGLTSSVYHLIKQLGFIRPDLIIQAGVAGCFTKKIPLGSVYIIKQDCIADESVIELNELKTIFDLNLVPHNQFPYKKGWLINPNTQLIKRSKLQSVKGISVNQITTNKKMIQFYSTNFNPVVESMEGAALHYVCLMENIPFLQIRSISNYIGERNKKNWNMKIAVTNLNKELIRMLEDL